MEGSANLIRLAGCYSDLEAECLRLMRDNAMLLEQLAEARQMAIDNWEVVEAVACGETLQCVVCGKSKPCLCDKL